MAANRRGRPVGKRPRRKRLLVVTNGEVTEPSYCDMLNDSARACHIVCKSDHVDPRTLASYAAKVLRNDERASRNKRGGVSDSYSAVFVVTDVDDTPASNLLAAQRICNDNGMQLVVSNPCFEVWLIDHLGICPESVDTAKEAERLAAAKGLVTGRRDKYLVRDALAGHVHDAVANAGRHNTPRKAEKRKGLQTVGFAPWTDMPALVQEVQ